MFGGGKYQVLRLVLPCRLARNPPFLLGRRGECELPVQLEGCRMVGLRGTLEWGRSGRRTPERWWSRSSGCSYSGGGKEGGGFADLRRQTQARTRAEERTTKSKAAKGRRKTEEAAGSCRASATVALPKKKLTVVFLFDGWVPVQSVGSLSCWSGSAFWWAAKRA